MIILIQLSPIYLSRRQFLSDFKTMVESYHAEGLSPVEYINTSQAYHSLTEQYASEFIDFLRFYDYSDVIIGDAES